MTDNDMIYWGIQFMLASIFMFNALKTKTEYTWNEAFFIMLLIDLPIASLLFWVISHISPAAACVWGILSPYILHKIADRIDEYRFSQTERPEEAPEPGPTYEPAEDEQNPPPAPTPQPPSPAEPVWENTVFQTLTQCLRCGKALPQAKCPSCGMDHTRKPIRFLVKIDPRDLQISKKPK